MDHNNPLNRKSVEKSSLTEVLPIVKNFNLPVLSKEDIKDLVEKPLVKACEIFWDKNIKTLESSANIKDIKGSGYIGLDFNSLSPENKEIAKQYAEPHELYVNDPNVLSVRIPVAINESDTIEMVSNKAVEIANQFNKQKANWISGTTLEEHLIKFEENFGDKYPDAVLKEKERLNEPGAWEEECKRKGEYFDAQTRTSWPSEELYKKANEDIKPKRESPKSNLEKIKTNNPEIFNLISDKYNADSILEITDDGKIKTEEGDYLNTPRVQELVRIMTAIKESLPSIPEGYVRLWRGNRKNEVGKNPQYTNSLSGIALPFLMGYGGHLSYVDISKEDAEKCLKTGAVAEGAEFMLPKELLSNVQIVGFSEEERKSILEKSLDLPPDEGDGKDWWTSISV